jgi:hypothetical protein
MLAHGMQLQAIPSHVLCAELSILTTAHAGAPSKCDMAGKYTNSNPPENEFIATHTHAVRARGTLTGWLPEHQQQQHFCGLHSGGSIICKEHALLYTDLH